MIESISNQRQTSTSFQRLKSVAVVGPDLDIDLCRVLTPGDKVLAEVNGVRFWSSHTNPLTAELPWEVVSNSPARKEGGIGWEGQIVLRHPRMARELVLGYDQLLRVSNAAPAVFISHDTAIQQGTLFVILQAVAFYFPADGIAEIFPPLPDNESLKTLTDRSFRIESLKASSRALSMLKDTGDGQGTWGYDGVTRFSLRTQMSVATIKALRGEDFDTAMELDRRSWTQVRRELHWLPMLLRQSLLVEQDGGSAYFRASAGDRA